MQRTLFVQVYAVKQQGRDQHRSVIFPADRATEGALVCEKWHGDESEVVQVLQRILQGTAYVTEVLGQAQSVEGWMGKLGLTDLEAALLGWRPELWAITVCSLAYLFGAFALFRDALSSGARLDHGPSEIGYRHSCGDMICW